MKRVPVSKLHRVCNPKLFKFNATNELKNLTAIIGQDRAIQALIFGLNIDNHGYNIYALGPVGTGKATIIRKYLQQEAVTKKTPDDWLYVNNFDNVDNPQKLQLPAGKGRELRDAMNQFVLELKTEIPKIWHSKIYLHETHIIEKDYRTQTGKALKKLSLLAEAHGLRLVQTSKGFSVSPKHANHDLVHNAIQETMQLLEQLRKDARNKILLLDQRSVEATVKPLLEALKNHYPYPAIQSFLTEIHNHLLKNIPSLKTPNAFEEYQVNLLVDNSKLTGAPVIFEKNPNSATLTGRIEQQSSLGILTTNFNMIKAGALHKANGGYLILDTIDISQKHFVWEILKKALKNQEITLENSHETHSIFTTKTLEPEAIPLKVKVVLLGTPKLYYLMHTLDPEFQELFKVKADFATKVPWSNKALHQYAQFVSTVCREENLLHVSPQGVSKIVEYAVRLAKHQDKISLKFGEIADIIRQASYWATKAQKTLVTASDVQKALAEKAYRANQSATTIHNLILEQTLKIATQGTAVGQINALSIITLGDYSFGKPSRVTAQTYAGSGIINIEREAKLGGKIHNKSTMIITGYLGGKYAQQAPLNFAGSITLEQSYEDIDGDSASIAEIYALLSSLSGYPLRQDLAVTGSVNQYGEVQAIGNINEKIEGFYQVCNLIGLTGFQGVVIPYSNLKNLMLHQNVLDAVAHKKFHIYAINTIDEGLELVTGIPAGDQDSQGKFPKNTVNYAVQKNIQRLAKVAINKHALA